MSDVGPALAGMMCPIPIEEYPHVTLAHGGGGRMTQMLVERMFAAAFANAALGEMHDGAVLTLPPGRVAISTDSFVVSPRFFPGGDIGSLAVHGTVNDLAMCAARPIAITAGFVLEEGLAMEELWRIVRSMAAAAAEAQVPVVTGDTKVVDRGKGDGIYINTTGIGVVRDGFDIAPRRARPGDIVLVNGPIAEHGIAILSVREGLEFESPIVSDSAALHGLVGAVLDAAGEAVHVLRDPTRGGVSSAMNEIAQASRFGIRLEETAIPIAEPVRGACEILGLDPLYVANEGKVLVIVAPGRAGAALAALRAHPLGQGAARIGEVVDDHPGRVFMKSRIGGMRVVDMLSGEQLPRIC
jgi:hydrogenase expression/formation protein HypE